MCGFLRNDWLLHRHLLPLIFRSSCPLQKLVLCLDQANMRSDDLIRCLEATPSLVELKLSFESCKSNLTDGVLHRLTRGASDGYLTPNLEVIELDLYKSTCTNQALVK